MAYLHCHSCDWGQDDFWYWKFKPNSTRLFGYNPLSLMIEDVLLYSKPRIIKYDSDYMKEQGWKGIGVFSWRVMVRSIYRHFRRLFTQKWWTYEGWKKVGHLAVCPNCGEHNFDID